MLGQRLVDAAGFQQRVVAVQFHDLSQIQHHLVAPAVVGNGQQSAVKGFIEQKKPLPVGRGQRQFLVQRLQLVQLRLGGGFGHHRRSV